MGGYEEGPPNSCTEKAAEEGAEEGIKEGTEKNEEEKITARLYKLYEHQNKNNVDIRGPS